MSATLRADDLHLAFGPDAALRGTSLTFEPGSSTAVMGRSGSGKSTLLKCLCGLLGPDSGSVSLGDTEISALSEARRARIRLQRFGVVFQFGELVPELTLLENVALPSMLLGVPRGGAQTRAKALLQDLGIADVADVFADQASGGQVQRAAVARALVHEPEVVLADEPTGALDAVTSEVVLDLLVDACRQRQATLVVVTHDHRVASQLERTVDLRDGRVVAAVTVP